MRLLFLAPLLVLAAAAAAASGSEWTTYTSMQQINQVLAHQGQVWCATSGGILRFDQAARTYARYTRLDGLAGNTVLSVAADPHGYLWFGTDRQGLSRFRLEDNRFDPPFLDFADLQINALIALDDRVFVGTSQGISVFLSAKEEVKETYRHLGRIPKDTEVTSLALSAGVLWAGTPEGIAWAALDLPNLQDPDSWSSQRALGEAEDLLALSDTLLVATRSGVFVLDPVTGKASPEFADTTIVSLGLRAGAAIAASATGLFYQRQSAGSWKRMPTWAMPEVRVLSRQDTALWVGTAQGLKVVGAEPPPVPREPAANHFYEMKLLGDGLWVASVPNDFIEPYGLYHFDGVDWTVYNHLNGPPGDVLVTLEADPAGRLWVGTWGWGVAIRDTLGQWQRLDQQNSRLQGIGRSKDFVAISSIARDAAGLMWVANVRFGVLVMEGYPPSRQQLYDQAMLGLSADHDIGKIAIAADGLKWIGTEADGFILLDDGGTPFGPGDDHAVLIDMASESRLTSNRIADLLVDGQGQLWVATDNGLNAIRSTYSRPQQSFQVESWRTYTTAEGLPSDEVNALATDPAGNLWVGTEAGLSRIGPGGAVDFTYTSANSGLIDNHVKSLLFDRQTNALWVGTFDGLSRLQVPQGGQAASGLRVYPNPFVLGGGRGRLTFAGLPLGAAVRIYTLDGQPVRELPGTPGQGTLSWDGQNAAGFLVSSGVYFFVADDGAGNRARGRVAVIAGR